MRRLLFLIIMMMGVQGWTAQVDIVKFKNNPAGCRIWTTTDAITGYTEMNIKDGEAESKLVDLIGGASDHGSLTGLTDTDHPQYLYSLSTTTLQVSTAPYDLKGSQFLITDPTTMTITANPVFETTDLYIMDQSGSTIARVWQSGASNYIQFEEQIYFTTDGIRLGKKSGTNDLEFYDPVLGAAKTLSQLAAAGLWEAYDSSNYYRLAAVPLVRFTSGGITQLPDYLQIDYDGTGGTDASIYFGPVSGDDKIKYSAENKEFQLFNSINIYGTDSSGTGLRSSAINNATLSVSQIIGVRGAAQTGESGGASYDVPDLIGVLGETFADSARTSNAYSIYAAKPYVTAHAPDVLLNAYSLYAENPTIGSSSNWSGYFAGDVNIVGDLMIGGGTTVTGAVVYTGTIDAQNGINSTTGTFSGTIEAQAGIDTTTADFSSYIDMTEIANPGASAASVVRVFANNEHLISLNEHDHWHDMSAGAGGASSGIHDAITVTDATGLNITWSAGEIYDANITGGNQMVTIAAEGSNQECTSNAVNYLFFDRSGGVLALSVTGPDYYDGDFSIAHILTDEDNIIDIFQRPLDNQSVYELKHVTRTLAPAIIGSGMLVSEHAAANAFDVDQSAGDLIYGGFEVIEGLAIESPTTAIIRWYHDANDEWATDTNTQIDAANWDDDDDGAAPIGNSSSKYYRSTFYTCGNHIHWLYPQIEYANLNAALAGNDPTPPAVLEKLPKTVTLVMKGNDAAFPVAGSDQWIDVRPIIGASGSGAPISDHGNLAGLSDDDHTQYLLADGTRALTTSLTITMNSDTMQIGNDGTHAWITWSDGFLKFRSAETNANTGIRAYGNGTGSGFFRAYSTDDSNNIAMSCLSNWGYIKTTGGPLNLQDTADQDIYLFYNATNAETRQLKIYGFKDGVSKQVLEIGVGVDAADTASFDGVANYWFDGVLQATGDGEFGGNLSCVDFNPTGDGLFAADKKIAFTTAASVVNDPFAVTFGQAQHIEGGTLDPGVGVDTGATTDSIYFGFPVHTQVNGAAVIIDMIKILTTDKLPDEKLDYVRWKRIANDGSNANVKDYSTPIYGVAETVIFDSSAGDSPHIMDKDYEYYLEAHGSNTTVHFFQVFYHTE